MKRITGLVIVAAALWASCNSSSTNSNSSADTTSNPASTIELLGAGATFPFPLYSKMFSEYNKKTGVKVNYQSIGSGGGIQQLESKTVDFGATDAYMKDPELKKAPFAIVHIPTCLGAVVLTYNLPNNLNLKFTPDIVSNIFLGKIKKWNDASIASVNTGVQLPDLPISVIHRSDGSGTTSIFTDYLSKVSAEWKTKVGAGKSVNWPIGLGGKGNEGVAGLIKETPGALGYLELSYALQNKMSIAAIQNAKGNYVAASLASTTAAANVSLPDDMRVSITNTDAPDGYPISSFTYIIVYKDLSFNISDSAKARQIYKLIDWMIHDGQQFNEALSYSKLPDAAVQKAEAVLKSITFQGKSLE